MNTKKFAQLAFVWLALTVVVALGAAAGYDARVIQPRASGGISATGFSPATGALTCGSGSEDCVKALYGRDITAYSDGGSTLKFSVDGATGNLTTGVISASRSSFYSPATLVVAASDSLRHATYNADYVCDGTNDQSEINSAITALATTGGRVVLLEGTYYISDSIGIASSNITLEGQGNGTLLKVPNSHSATMNVISATSVSNVAVKNLRIDGNRANVAAGTQYYNGIKYTSVTSATIDGVSILNGEGNSGDGYGFWIVNSSMVSLKNSSSSNWDYEPVEVRNSTGVDISGNMLDYRIELYDNVHSIRISDNVLVNMQIHVGTDTGVNSKCRNVQISNNVFHTTADRGSGYGLVWLSRSIGSQVVGNTFYISGTNASAVLGASASGGNLIANNAIWTSGVSAYGINGVFISSTIASNVCNAKSNAAVCVNAESGSSYNNIADNLSENTTPSSWSSKVVYLQSGANQNQVRGNICSNAGNCVHIASDSNVVSGNRAMGQFGRGLWLTGNSNIVEGNHISGTITTAAVTDTGSGNSYRGNYGYTSSASGTATVPNTATVITVTHGISFTPSINKIKVTPTNNLGTATKFWISDVGATTFLINVDADPGAGTATFVWAIGDD